jgi:hypothetical protein
MLDQQTGLRAFLLTGERAFLEPYERGRRDLARQNEKAREAFAQEPDQLALLRENERRQRAWISEWAVVAVRGMPDDRTRPTSCPGQGLFDDRAGEGRAGSRRRRRPSEARQCRLLVPLG